MIQLSCIILSHAISESHGTRLVYKKMKLLMAGLIDRNGDGQADVMYFDFKRSGKWDLSFWDENYDGHWTLVGYHPDGSLTPSRFESYAAFQNRKQAQR
jgi:hypothetical protein